MPVGLHSSWWALSLLIIPAGLVCAPTLTTVTDTVSRLAPESVRGQIMGLHTSAITAGFAIGAPLAGIVIDVSSPAWAFAVAGVTGMAAGSVGWLVGRRDRSVRVPDDRAPERQEASSAARISAIS